MWADTEIRRDLVWGWRNEAFEPYREPAALGLAEDPNHDGWRYF